MLSLGDLQSMLPRKQKLEDRLKELTHRADIMVFMKGDPDVSRDMLGVDDLLPLMKIRIQ